MASSAEFDRICATDYPSDAVPGVRRTEFGLLCTWSGQRQLLNATCTQGALDAWERHCQTEKYRNGEVLIGYLDGKPVARAGWYTVAGVARFRTIVTQPAARGQRAGVSLIRHIQNHDDVRRCDFLSVFTLPPERGGAQQLYERLGFARIGERWKFSRETD